MQPIFSRSFKIYPFHRWGDIELVAHNQLKSCCFVSIEEPDRLLEFTVAAVEAKMGTSQSIEDIMLQLQANMLLCSVNQLQANTIRDDITIETLEAIQQITTYGIAVCATDRSNIVLRMTCDLRSNSICTDKLFEFNIFSPVAMAKFDSVLEFVVQRLLPAEEEQNEEQN